LTSRQQEGGKGKTTVGPSQKQQTPTERSNLNAAWQQEVTMRRFMTFVAVVGLTLTAIGGAQAGSRGHSISHSSSVRLSVHVNPGFNYRVHGTRFLNYSCQTWCAPYGCYLYWNAIDATWYFYVPAQGCYLPVRHFPSVFGGGFPALALQAPITPTPLAPPIGQETLATPPVAMVP
jgi:hypothetical protein